MKQLNKEPISWHGEKLLFFATRYVVDNSLAIVCETVCEEPFATLTDNLLFVQEDSVFKGRDELH